MNTTRNLKRLEKFFNRFKFKGQSAQTAEHVDLENILPVDRDYCTYNGYLTTPEFQEVVTWVVLKKPVMVSNRVMDMMKEFRYGGESSNKMVNCRKAASSGDRVVMSPGLEKVVVQHQVRSLN